MLQDTCKNASSTRWEGCSTISKIQSIWTSKTQSLAMNLGSLSKGPWTWDLPTHPELERLSDLGGRNEPSLFLMTLFRSFPKLKEFIVIMDRKVPDDRPPIGTPQFSIHFEDSHDLAGGDISGRWIPGALKHLKELFPDLHQPHVCLARLTEESNPSILRRRDNYLHACCKYCEAGLDRQRSEFASVSPPGSDAANPILPMSSS
ncbi:hypothetical protein ONS95_005853 [Cadophora gregata]|uniref:uncharacterized protein n=1 Tax=Cadophora gregata TaxID=51156 RepID=UPI0026DB8C85|nr:uncharacterized protein ONS95_005853 [Cadophora gregata]KAK0102230.1 hypothetical protein ONS95_005853 [Cadophora gregata]